MKLSVGIVGLPNVGKSTLFNALLEKQQAYAANFPFATVEPNVGVVPVKDGRLVKLAEIVETENIVPATVKFVDIAGLVKGASQGEGLGNKFLAHIREVSAIVHVVRYFKDSEVVMTGSGDWAEDYQTIETELQLADLATLEKQKPPKGKVSKEEEERWQVIEKLRAKLAEGVSAREVELREEEKELVVDLFLLTMKPVIVVVNVGEEDLSQKKLIEEEVGQKLGLKNEGILALAAKVEAELVEFDPVEREEYLRELGVETTGLDRLVKQAYQTLGLQSFLTAGKKEVRAWTIRQGMTARQAAGVIHSDFEKGFIMAKVCSYDDFVKYGGWKGAGEAGKVRQEGRDYVMQEGDVVEFMVN